MSLKACFLSSPLAIDFNCSASRRISASSFELARDVDGRPGPVSFLDLAIGLELAKLARRSNGQEFDCATWLHARELPKEEFRREVEKELTGKDSETSEIMYFKFYRSQIPVIEQAIEAASLMLGTDKSRGYCLEMICADFLAGANLDSGQPDVLLNALSRFFEFLPGEQRQTFAHLVAEATR
jgi:hypothetical protein